MTPAARPTNMYPTHPAVALRAQAKKISQATFHAAVAENMVEFGMDKAEAVGDAIEQFKQQGVDLTGLDLSGDAVRDDGTIEVCHAINGAPLIVVSVLDAGWLPGRDRARGGCCRRLAVAGSYAPGRSNDPGDPPPICLLFHHVRA